MKHFLTFFLLAGFLLGLSGCKLNNGEYLNGIVAQIGCRQITDEDDLIGTRILKDDADRYTGNYSAQCDSMTGRDVIFGGASIHNRTLFLSGTLQRESGKATVRIRLNEEVIELEPDDNDHFETTLKLESGGNYIMVVYEDFSGKVEMTCKYMDDET